MIVRNYRLPPAPGDLNRYAVSLDPYELNGLGFGFRRGSAFRQIIGRTVKAATGRDLPGSAPAPAPTGIPPIAPPKPGDPILMQPLPHGPGAPGPGSTRPTPGQAAAAAVKEYADVSAYRNILDMLQTFEGVLNRFGQSIAKQLNCINKQGIVAGGRPCSLPKSDDYVRIGASGSGCYAQAAIGYAASKIGAKGKAEARMYAEQVAKSAGLALRKYNVGFFEVPDLLNLARTINYEMNRVRLPVPHNFRQIANAIQGREYRMCSGDLDQVPGLPVRPATHQESKQGHRGRFYKQKMGEIVSQHYINGIELMTVYKNLKTAINAMRVGVRKEIDAANLAAKVEEQTIRAEQEALISRQQAAENARKREIEILAEKRKAYEAELAEAERIKNEAAKIREDMAAELEQLAAARQAAETPEEVAAVEEKTAEVVTAGQLAEQMEQDMMVNQQTSAQAAHNLNNQVRQIQAEQVQSDQLAVEAGVPPKKTNLTPILLTVAAGVLLT